MAKAGIVSQPQSQNYSSTNYRLVGWSQNPASTGSDLWKFNARVNTQADGNSVTLYGVWALKSYIVSFRLVGGTLAGSLPAGVTAVDPASTSLKEATALVSYNADGKIDSLSLTGINNGTTLAEYYITVALTEDGQQVSFALSDLDSILVKPNYNLTGIFASRADTTEGNAFDAVAVADDRTMYAIWQLDITDYAQYYLDTYIFTLKPDNTYAITGLKANAVEENLIIPDEFQQIAVTEIAAGAFTGNTNITQVDFSEAVNLRKIGDNAFAYCTSLETMSGIDALENLVEVGYNAVTGTGWLSAQTGDVVLGQVLVRYGGAQLDGDADLSAATYKYIARGAFVNASFSSVVLPDDIVGIDDYAFAYMGGLASVTANGTAIEYISSNAFEGTAFVNSATVNLVIGNVFYRAANTETVPVPAGVTVIAEEAFLNCYTVANVDFEDEAAILTVGANAFDGTAYAKNDEDGFLVVNGILAGYYGESETAVVPSDITAIGAGAFRRDVVNVIFQDWSVKSFADFAFADATALEGIYFIQAATAEHWQDIDFAGYAFAAESGLALVSNFTLYYTSVTPLGVDGIDPALDFLTSVNTYQTSYAIDDEVVKNVFTDNITTVDAAAVAALWDSSAVANEDGTLEGTENNVYIGFTTESTAGPDPIGPDEDSRSATNLTAHFAYSSIREVSRGILHWRPVRSDAFWAIPQYLHDRRDRDDFGVGFDAQLRGITVGKDFTTDNGFWGAAFGYGDGNIHSLGGIAYTSGDVQSWWAGIYGQHNVNDWRFEGILSYLCQDADQDQSNSAADLHLNTKNDVVLVSGKVARNFVLDKNAERTISMTPSVGLEYVWLKQRDFNVRMNSGETLLKGEAEDMNIFSVPVDLRFDRDWAGDNGWRHNASVTVGGSFNFGDDTMSGDFTGPNGVATDGWRLIPLDNCQGRVAAEYVLLHPNQAFSVSAGAGYTFSKSRELLDLQAVIRYTW